LPQTRLREILGTEKVAVNSFHHQSVRRLGDDLVLSARSPDGVVEGIEMPRGAKRFVVGVQWHPEWNFRDNPESLALLDAFRDACQRHAAAR